MNYLQKLALKFANIPTYQTGKSLFYGTENGFSFNGTQQDGNLINEGFVSNTDVYSIVKKHTETASSIPFVLNEIDRDGKKEAVTSGEYYDLLQQPNSTQSIKEFKEQATGFLLLTGDTFLNNLVGVGSSVVDEINILESQLTEVQVSKINEVTGYIWDLDGLVRKYNTEEVTHLKYFNPSKLGIKSHRGLSPIQAGYRTLSASNDLITAQASFWKNKGASGILSNGSQAAYTEPQKKDLQKVIDSKLGGAHNANRVIATTANVSFQQLGMSPSDLKIIESGVLNLRQLCNLYGHPSALYNDPNGLTYNSFETALKVLYTQAVIPTNDRLIEYFNNVVTPGYNRKDNKRYIVEQDLSKIEALQSDQKIEAEKDKVRAEGIGVILSMAISSEAKEALLVSEYGFNTEEAAKILIPAGVKNSTLEVLRSLSPLLANKLVEQLTPEEVRQLLNK